jgi:hypothetical protein
MEVKTDPFSTKRIGLDRKKLVLLVSKKKKISISFNYE